ncbi:MAG: thiamine-phosphate kinase [Halobacteria archaeon]|nr:thiamine-phosphate kinase [Halobacteria archaeon]
MEERKLLDRLSRELGVGDDCAVLEFGGDEAKALLTTDMLHRKTDFPEGLEAEVMGWRGVGASLSDVAGMGGDPVASVLAVGVPGLEEETVEAIIKGARDVCEEVSAEYVGGDLDSHDELTVTSTVLGRAESPVRRSGAEVGDAVCVTGELGATALGLRLFEEGENETANGLFRFEPRVAEGIEISEYATSMMDISDGLSVSLHQTAEASDVGFEVESERIPRVDGVDLEEAVFTGEDFELLFTAPRDRLDEISAEFTVIGDCVDETEGVSIDAERLEKRGYQHGD